MKLESLSKKLNSKIKEILKNENFTNEQISVICNKYFSFDSQKDFTHPKYEHPYFFPIVQQISLGISNLNNIENDVNFKEKTKLFKGYLKRNNLNMNEILSLFDYTRNSDIILKFQRTIKNVENEVQITKDIYLKGIKSYFRNNSENENLNYKKIQLLVEKINFDTSLQEFKNHFNQIFDNLLSSGEIPSYIVDITNELFEDLYSIKEKYNTNFSVDSALSAPLPNNVVLYRAISRVSKTIRNLIGNSRDYSSLIGKKIEDKGFTSTSLLYNTSFAMYEDYDIVFKIFTPQGTLGRNITPISYCYSENEVLLKSNDMYILDCDENYVDGLKQNKILYTVLLLSKDRSCYKNLGQENKKIIENENI